MLMNTSKNSNIISELKEKHFSASPLFYIAENVARENLGRPKPNGDSIQNLGGFPMLLAMVTNSNCPQGAPRIWEYE